MRIEIDERGQQFFCSLREFSDNHPHASWTELDRYIEKKLHDFFGDTLPPEKKNSLTALGRAWRN